MPDEETLEELSDLQDWMEQTRKAEEENPR